MPNRLQQATSPYLLQHADNPVDWYPWGDESLALARQQDKPILLSIGYSACHWCHVMAHESFEDAATAVVMNELFVNIKVDREERPDLDKIYQTAHQLLSQRPGGWPLTVFLTPDDRIPFFAGTYFPSEHRHGLPAFRELLRSVAEFYHTHHAAIVEQNQSLLEGLRSLMPKASDSGRVLGLAPLDVAHRQLGESFDRVHGGFGTPPKFPHPTSLQRLLRHWTLTRHHGKPDEQAATMLQHTLAHMALGGMNDQLAGGFCRYSVDERWEIPHFEKMLYDNGALLSVYTQAWAASGNSLFEATVRGTANWIMTTMQSPDGGYYSSMDADSEGEEGRYYVWSRERVRELLSEEEYRPFATLFGLNDTPNFEGRWHLHATPESLKKAADFEDFAILIASAKSKLLAERVTRVPPGTDDKVLTSWNALAIKGMAMAARLFDEAAWRYSAEKAVVFIRATLWKDGRLLATARNGEAQLNAYLDDYVFLIDALLELLQCRWRAEYYDFAVQLAEVVLDHFDDPSDGGFFFTADDQEALLYRPKPLTDDATPSGNGVAAQVLGRMGHLSGDARYLDAARRTLELAWPEVNAMPYAYCSLLDALEEYLEPPRIIVLRGPRTAINAWRRCVDRHYLPGRICLAIDETATDLPDTLAQPLPANGGVAAYICEGTQCRAPITDQAAFETILSQP